MTLLQDLRFAIRVLIKNPIFTLVAVATLALGIGANSAIFSVVNSILIRPLPYQRSEELVLINHVYPKLDLRAAVSVPGYLFYKDHSQSFQSMAAVKDWEANLTGDGEPERVDGTKVTGSFFATLGVPPAQGRDFAADDTETGRDHVAVISEGLWRRRLGGQANVIGHKITVNGESYSIIGVMPRGFAFGREFGATIDLFVPLAFTPQENVPDNFGWEFLTVVARLKPGVTQRQAQAELDTTAANLRHQYMNDADPSNWGIGVTSLRQSVVGDIRPALFVLFAAVGFVLLIACVNVANLLLARAAVRQKEIAIRLAVGAKRGRVIRQLLTESVLLALVGGGLGLLIAYWGVSLLVRLNETNIPRAQEIGLDGRVVLFTLGISVLTGILFGLAPAIRSSRNELVHALKDAGRSGSSGLRQRFRSSLVIAEISLSLVVLVGAGLLIRSFWRVQQVDPGFRADNILAMSLALPDYKYHKAVDQRLFFDRLLQATKALPGVQSVSETSALPLSGSTPSSSFYIEGRPVATGQQAPHGDYASVSPDYFQTLGIKLIRGRIFTEHDNSETAGVVIIDETVARKYWAGEDPIGRRITFEGERKNPLWREIIGIVGHVKSRALDGESRPQYYVPLDQRPESSMFLAVRTTGGPSSVAPAVRALIHSLDKDLPVYRVTTMEQLVASSLAQRQFSTLLLGVFALIALLLAAVGLYGVTAYSVTQRTHEIGLRVALGAQRSDVLKLVVGQGMVLTVIGVAIGLASAAALTRVMSTMLFGVAATDRTTFIAVSLVVVIVALLACYIPARRATKVDPLVALRYE